MNSFAKSLGIPQLLDGVGNAIRALTGKATFRPDYERDVFLVSYPRSGNTWLRAMVSELVTGKQSDSLTSLDFVIPDIHYPVPASKVVRQPFYLVKSHEPLSGTGDSRLYRRVIYVVRDPRDVVQSYHRYLLNNGMPDCGLEEFVFRFCDGEIWPGTWHDHVADWMDRAGSDHMLVLRYESLLAHPGENLRSIATFLGVRKNDEELRGIVARYDRTGMMNLEKAGNRQSRGDKLYFIGSATSNTWQLNLSVAAHNRILATCGEVMQRVGYPVSAW